MRNSNINSDKIRMAKDISKALEENNTDVLNNVLPKDKMSKLMNILQNEELMQKIANSEDAKALLNKFGKE